MTGTQLVTWAAKKLGDANFGFFSETDIRDKINEGSKQVARDTKCVRSNFTLTTVASTSVYTFASETEFLSASDEGVWIYDGTDWEEVDVVSFDYLNEEYPDWKNASNDQPSHCVIEREAKRITLYPPPSSTYAGADYLKIYTVELTPDITAWTSELILPDDLHFACAFWACKDGKEDRGFYTQAAYWKKMYDEKVGKGAVDTLHNPARKIRVRSYKD